MKEEVVFLPLDEHTRRWRKRKGKRGIPPPLGTTPPTILLCINDSSLPFLSQDAGAPAPGGHRWNWSSNRLQLRPLFSYKVLRGERDKEASVLCRSSVLVAFSSRSSSTMAIRLSFVFLFFFKSPPVFFHLPQGLVTSLPNYQTSSSFSTAYHKGVKLKCTVGQNLKHGQNWHLLKKTQTKTVNLLIWTQMSFAINNILRTCKIEFQIKQTKK